MSGKLKTSWLARAAKVGSLAAGTAGHFVKAKLKGDEDAELKAAAEAVRDQLGHLKGALMKFGQMASYVDGNIPEHIQEILSSLQDSTPPMEPAAVRQVFVEQLGRPPEELFAEWDANAIAAASIGQVHKARLQSGELVAVKVQYPGVKAAIAADLQNAGTVAPLLKAIFHSLDTAEIIDEIRERSLEECDYRIEAKNQATFARIFAGSPDVVVPKVFPELSSEGILVTEYVEAVRFRDFLMRSSQAQRDRAAMIMHSFVCESIFVHEIFNADPHPGNYLFLPDGRVCFLDYGCVKTWVPGTIDRWKEMLLAAIHDDFPRWKACWETLGMVVNAKAYDFEYEFAGYRKSIGPLLADAEFRMTRADLKQRQEALVHGKNKRHSTVPRDFVMVTRLLFGLESILALLNAKGNFHRNALRVLTPGAAAKKAV
jgi:predicted unusual protein kinase regulating ubiquinone biosynthesis (AarF/ABC1/UbiB family)